jgi:flagella basal body P-ring formation protein FlgA
MMPLAAFAMAGCLAVSAGSDRIVAGDLAPAFPALSAVPADTAIAPAPAPGVSRRFSLAELNMLAARFQVMPATQELCIERPVAPLTPARLLEAMRRVVPEARIEILEYSRQPAPQGEIEFPRTQLRASSAGPLWTGYVRYAANRRFTIWARVQVLVKVDRVLAIADLHPGKPIAPGDVMVAAREEFPAQEPFATAAGDVVGRLPRVLIPAGSAVRTAQLDDPKDVIRGDIVTVEVHNGPASLKLEAQAEGSGVAGQTILVRNPTSGKSFRVRVEGKGLVSLNASASKVNP